MVEGGMKLVKYLVFLFNLLFVISGVALVAIGGVLKGYYGQYLDFLGNGVVGVPILLIIVGIVIFAVAFLGCCGAVRENHCMVLSFSILLALIFILELSAGVAAYVFRNDLRHTLVSNMGKTMRNYGKEKHGGVTATWDKTQNKLHCCGSVSYRDWESTMFSQRHNNSVPSSCCLVEAENCGAQMAISNNVTAARHIYTDGCLLRLEAEAKDNVAAVAGVGVGIAFLQVLGIVLTCFLARSIKKGYETV